MGRASARARSRPLRASVRALRRAGDRRRRRRSRGGARRGGGRRARDRSATKTRGWAAACADAGAAIEGRAASRLDRGDRIGELAQRPDVTLLLRTTAFGYYDGNLVGAVERVTDHLPVPPPHVPRQRLWKIRAKAVVLATGAHRARIAYATTICPGTMLAGAARTYVERYGVLPGIARRGLRQQRQRIRGRARLARWRRRRSPPSSMRGPPRRSTARCRRGRAPRDLPIIDGSAIVGAHGRLRVASVDVAPLAGGASRRVECDLVCVSGGWNPAVHLFSQARGKLALRRDAGDVRARRVAAADRCRGRCEWPLRIWRRALRRACRRRRGGRERRASRHSTLAAALPTALDRDTDHAAVDRCPRSANRRKRFVDLQNDVTVNDIALAAREGYQVGRAPEALHDARHGHRPGQDEQHRRACPYGRAARRARFRSVGTTTFRPPYTPVTMGALPGHEAGAHVEPTRHSPMHEWHAEHGARFVNAGLWKRPHSYPRAGETEEDAANREARNVRDQRRDRRRLDARQDRVAGHATSPNFSIASTSTDGTRSRSAAAATA